MNCTLQTYLQSLQAKRIVVAGLGISNRPLVRLLAQAGLDVTACDKTPYEKLSPEILDLQDLGVRLHVGADYLQNLTADVVFRTPGLHPAAPELQNLLQGGAELTSEMEAFFQVCPCPILAVTGSDGKTTTTSLIAEFLRRSGKTVWLGGNIGRPLLDLADRIQPSDLAVLELSSFQLMTMRCSPHVAVVTNISPNHLDIHTDMAEYVTAKTNIFRFQSPADRLILNLDNSITRDFANISVGSVRWFSHTVQPAQGIFCQNGLILRKNAAGIDTVLDRRELLLPGDHNVENFMAAMAAVEGLVGDEIIRDVARSFPGVEHRIELVRELDGVRYYNDSIASSPSRTIAGLRSFSQKVILIAGGYDKHIPYDTLGPEILQHVKTLILTGATAPKIRAAAEAAPGFAGQPPILDAENLSEAVRLAHQAAHPGDVVILSPASASFDCFKNFEHRGNVFRQLVADL